MEEREASERKSEILQKKLQELFSALNITIGTEYGQITPASFDKLITQVTTIVPCSLKENNSFHSDQ